MAGTSKVRQPPYISDNLWEQFFKQLGKRNIPNDLRIADLKGWAVAIGQENALFSALVFLGLVTEDGITTDKLRSLVGTEESRAKNLGTILQDAYSQLYNEINLEKASSKDIMNYFAHNHSNASAGKMVRSFLCLARRAGLNLPAISDMRSGKKAIVTRKPREARMKDNTSNDITPPKHFEKPESSEVHFESVELARAMKDWDVEKVRAFFEELRRLKGESEKR